MSLKKKAALAVILSLILAQNSAGVQPKPLTVVPQTEFREVVIYDTFEHPKAQATRIPAPTLTPTVKVIIKQPTVSTSKHKKSLVGLASYYCCTNGYSSSSYVGAAGPKLRVALGGGYPANASQPWKGKTVIVCGSKDCKAAKLVDWCQCYWKQDHEKVIDLHEKLFYDIGAERGTVTISW